MVRGQIKEFAGTKRLFSSGVKLVILDEADAMTNDAQFALRRGALWGGVIIKRNINGGSGGGCMVPPLGITKSRVNASH